MAEFPTGFTFRFHGIYEDGICKEQISLGYSPPRSMGCQIG